MHNGAIMPSEVTRQVDTGLPYPVVHLAGVLDAGSAPAVRSALLEVLAAQPEAAVLEVSGLLVAEPAATSVLSDLAADIVEWPATRLVLATDDPSSWGGAGLPTAPDVTTAVTRLGRPSTGDRLALDLLPVVGAARRSREMLTGACDRWGLPDLAASGCIVVTEMVNNAVAHAQTPMTVLLGRRDGSISVAVRDHSVASPRFTGQPVAPTSYGGRGLLLIDSVAGRWGSLALDDGKVVWALLPTGEENTGRRSRLDSAGMADPARG